MKNEFRQLTIFDVPGIKIDFEIFQNKFCKHQRAYLKFGDDEEAVKACDFKNGYSAQCLEDWQKCEISNCPFWKMIE